MLLHCPSRMSSISCTSILASIIQGGRTGTPACETRRAFEWCPSCSTDVWSDSVCHSSWQAGSSWCPTVWQREPSLRFWKFLCIKEPKNVIRQTTYSTTRFLQSECLNPSRNETSSGPFLKVPSWDRCRMRCFLVSVMWPRGLTFLFVKPADAAAVVVWFEQQLSEELPQMDGLAGVAAHHVWPRIVIGFCGGGGFQTTLPWRCTQIYQRRFSSRPGLTWFAVLWRAALLHCSSWRTDQKSRLTVCTDLLPPLIKLKQVWFVCTFICTCYGHYIKVYAQTNMWFKLLVLTQIPDQWDVEVNAQNLSLTSGSSFLQFLLDLQMSRWA